MKAATQVREEPNVHVMLIMRIRDNVRLLNKCRRKMSMSAIDPDNYRIYVAAYKQLQQEINSLCHEAGL